MPVVFASLLTVSAANASVIVGLVYNPATTAGAGSNSNRSGAGTWHLYAVDQNSNDFGISSFDVALTNPGGTIVAANRAPQTNYDDGNSNPVSAGFNLLRQTIGSNTSTVELTGAQPTPPSPNSSGDVGFDYFPISGFGQTASSFAAKYPNVILGPTTGSQWGTYNDFAINNDPVLSFGHKWVFLGEGTYTGFFNLRVTSAVTTVYTNFSTTFASLPPSGGTLIVNPQDDPEPATLALAAIACITCISFRRGFAPIK